MPDTELIASLKKIVKPYIQDEAAFEKLTEETHFIDDLKVNSAHLVDIVLDLEDEYDIEIEDEALENMLTVKAAVDIIQQKIKDK